MLANDGRACSGRARVFRLRRSLRSGRRNFGSRRSNRRFRLGRRRFHGWRRWFCRCFRSRGWCFYASWYAGVARYWLVGSWRSRLGWSYWVRGYSCICGSRHRRRVTLHRRGRVGYRKFWRCRVDWRLRARVIGVWNLLVLWRHRYSLFILMLVAPLYHRHQPGSNQPLAV